MPVARRAFHRHSQTILRKREFVRNFDTYYYYGYTCIGSTAARSGECVLPVTRVQTSASAPSPLSAHIMESAPEYGVLPPREGVKLRADGREAQRKRRESVLASQKARRAAQTAAGRTSHGAPPSSLQPAETGESTRSMVSDSVAIPAAVPALLPASQPSLPPPAVEAMDATHSARGTSSSRTNVLMTPEWMVDVPSDLASCWLVAPRPAGRRCLVISGGANTRAHWRGGKPRTFPSALPNGSRATRSGGSATCELDCIWVEADQTFYVVDVLSWKDHRLVDCPWDFRRYWLAAKLAETRAGTACSTNPYRFELLGFVECSAASLRSAYFGSGGSDAGQGDDCARSSDDCAGGGHDGGAGSGGGMEVEDGATAAHAQRDGLLFAHREALYEPGSSPLLLSWSDAICSSRFYDYGSQRMADAIVADPSKASRWRTDEVDAACTFAELLAVTEQPSMEAEEPMPQTHPGQHGTDSQPMLQ